MKMMHGPINISSQVYLFGILNTVYPSLEPVSSVGIATELRPGQSGIESRWERNFPPVQKGPGATQPRVKWVPGFSRG